MPNRNPNKPHRFIEANERKTVAKIEQYHGLMALLATWDKAPAQMQFRNHDYILRLRARARVVKNCVLHRADPNANL